VTAALLARSIVERRYLTVRYLVDLLAARSSITTWEPGLALSEPVTFVGLSVPDGLPAGSETYGLDRLNRLIPD